MTNRQCFPCTACCEGWLVAEIHGLKIKPGKPCIHAQKQGCGIYESRPKVPCVTFRCGWLQEQNGLPEQMKPSASGAIVLFDRKWHDRDVIWAIPTGSKIPDDTLEWLMALSREKFLPLLFCEFLFEEGKYLGSKHIGYGPPAFVNAVRTEIGPEDILMY